jgi:DNA repair exonuclease SbcCD nuclease subunit
MSSDQQKTSALENVVHNINAKKDGQVDFVLVTGDVVASIYDHADRHNKESRIGKVVSQLQKLNVPYFIGLGNHDYRIDGNANSTYSQAKFTRNQTNEIESIWKEQAGIEPYYAKTVNGWKIIMLNSMHGISTHEHLGSDQTTWLEGELQSATGPIIVTMHHPIEITSGAFWLPAVLRSVIPSKDATLWGDGPVTHNTDPRLFELIAEYQSKIKLILVGHGHQFKAGKLWDIPVRETAALGEPQYAYNVRSLIGFAHCKSPRVLIEGDKQNITKIQDRCDD